MPHHDENAVRQNFWPKLQQNLAKLPFAEDAVAAWYCAFDTATPLRVKATLIAALAYFILPFDVIPDVILGLGFTDDMAVLLTAMSLMKTHITQIHRDKAKEALDILKQGASPTGSQS
jgi:uncharacterized membrane protein YkvA (DUF1232 family)